MVPGFSRTSLAMVGMMGLSTASIRADWRFMLCSVLWLGGLNDRSLADHLPITFR
jgi:hypothetical protein